MTKFNANEITKTISQAIGFKSKVELMKFIKEQNIKLSDFQGFNDFENAVMKKQIQVQNKKQLQSINEIHKLRKEVIKVRAKQATKLKLNNTVNYTVEFIAYSEYKPDAAVNVKASDIISDEKGQKYYKRFFGTCNTKDTSILAFNRTRTYHYDRKKFVKLVKMLETALAYISDGIHCIVVKSVNMPTEKQVQVATRNTYFGKKPIKEKDLFNSDINGGFYHNYIEYDINKEATSFNELFNIPIETSYCKDNYKTNSCYINLLVDTFHTSFSKCKKFKFNATYEDFCDLLDINLKDDNIGLSVNKSLKFFEKFNLSLMVIGVFGIIEAFVPEKRNKNISPDSLYMLVSNGHCYKLNKDVKSFQQKLWSKNEQLEKEMSNVNIYNLKSEYRIRETANVSYDVTYINKLDEICEHVKNSMDCDNKMVKYVYDGDLQDLLFKMTTNSPTYYPNVYMEAGKVMRLSFKLNDVMGVIETCNNKHAEDTNISLSPDIYEAYHKADDELYKALFTPEHMSHYNPNNVEFEKQYQMRPMCGHFSNDDAINITYSGVDSRKAYTSDFMDIKFYPVYSYFDTWKEYDDHPIEDYSQYLVLCNSKFASTIILFPDLVTRTTGYMLNRIKDVKYTILSYKRPSKLVESNSTQIIEKLWTTEISDIPNLDNTCKKNIFNLNSGLLEKKLNKKSFSKVFKNYDEAFYYQTSFGGEIFTLGDVDNVFMDQRRQLFILHKKEEIELSNGYVPIKEMIYSIRSLKNYNTACKLQKNGIKVVGIKTDSILINDCDVKKAKKLFNFEDRIGFYKMQYKKMLPTTLIERTQNKHTATNKFDVVTHKIKDEFNIKEINKVIDKHDVVTLGKLPGVGKTTTACNYECKKKLFVSPYNKLCQQLKKKGFDAITLNMLLGYGANNAINLKMKSYNIQPYDCIVFDEILLYTPKLLMKIDNFMKKNKHIKFLSTGDCNQNTPIGKDGFNNIKDKQSYLMNCIDIMFPNQIVLETCKRLKDKKDIAKLINLKEEILDTTKDVIETLKKYKFRFISELDDLKTTNNICFFNYRCDVVNAYVHNNLVVKPKKIHKINKVDYWAGLELVCKEHYKAKGIRLFVNYVYVIKTIGEKFFVINEPVEDIDITLNIALIKHFKLPYANTNHSVQGMTIEDNYTIFDSNTAYVNRNWA